MASDPEIEVLKGNTAADPLPYATNNTVADPLPYMTSNTAVSDEAKAGYSYSLSGDTFYAKLRRAAPGLAAGALIALGAVALTRVDFNNPFAGTLPSAGVHSLSAEEGTLFAALSLQQQPNYKLRVQLSIKKVSADGRGLSDYFLFNALEKAEGYHIVKIPIDSRYQAHAMSFAVLVNNHLDLSKELYRKVFHLKDLPSGAPAQSSSSS